jgi:uncharacterized protein YdaU (DUF1376 family)
MASSWFPFFGRDFLAATLGWSADERGHYITLLIAQWEQGGLPDDLKRLELVSPGVSKCWKTIEKKFPKSTGGQRRNTRLEHERHLSHQRSERARQSASARWSKGQDQAEEGQPEEAAGCSEQCSEQCDRICDRTCSADASMSMSYSPPPPPPAPPEFRDGWEQLRTAWNAVWGEKRQWRSAEPPQEAIDRLAEPGWLDEALAAIPEIKKGACSGFASPPTLRQFCKRDERGTFVARMLGGEFVDKVRPTPRRALQEGAV